MKEYIYTTQVSPNLEIKHYRDIIVERRYYEDEFFLDDIIRPIGIAVYVFKTNEHDEYTDMIPISSINRVMEYPNGNLCIKYTSSDDELRDTKIRNVDLILSQILESKQDDLDVVESKVSKLTEEINTIKKLIEERYIENDN